ncbi:MAG: NAD(P)/FAD-dependent oxidoreductase, partial [Anaerolineales bacterium]
MSGHPYVVIGAGPAGLTAAWELSKRGVPTTVVEKYHLVGGIARTERHDGYYFDIGGHRFFTKVAEVEALWLEWMAEDFLLRPRISRIYYDGKFFHYPLKAFNALFGLGVVRSIGVLLSYLQSQLFPYKQEDTFEQWVSNRFGKRLYEIFFKTYTEKVWGIPCSDIRAEWAAQRIKGLSLPTAIRNALFPPRGEVIKTLIEEFHYPPLGPGMMWERVADLLRERGHSVCMETAAVRILREGSTVRSVEVRDSNGTRTLAAAGVISTMPLSELIRAFDPPPPDEVRRAADQLAYRDFLTVVLIVAEPHLFDDNWIYIHSPEVRVGRIQNFKNWSPHMVPDPARTSLGLEYFCDEGDDLWSAEDEELIQLGIKEMSQIGLLRPDSVVGGVVVRQQKAYPIYDARYGQMLAIVKTWLRQLENFQTVGRNGLHKYNNQDHSMLTAMMAVRNLIDGEAHDVWEVNTDRSYHEEVRIPDGADHEQPVDIL